MFNKGRANKSRVSRNYGERNSNAKFTYQEVLVIKKSKVGTMALARKYGVHRNTITNIRSDYYWKRN